MLILARKRDEVILIGDDIEIMVVDIQAGKVRLGIKAPENITIVRKELIKEKEKE